MRRNKREGFQFSFGLKDSDEPYSARSTPKFPSIQIGKPTLGGSERKNYSNKSGTELTEPKKSPWDLFQDIGGGIELLQRGKNAKERPLQLRGATVANCNDTLSVGSKDNKSVKSTKSLGERFLRQARQEKQARTIVKREKHSNSLANILELRMESSSPTFKRLEERKSIKPSPFTLGKPLEAIEDAKSEERDTLKMDGPFFEGAHNMEFRQTKKMVQAFERSRLGEGEREKSRVFKNFLHKPRPTLRLGQRNNNNDRIDSISRKCDSPF